MSTSKGLLNKWATSVAAVLGFKQPVPVSEVPQIEIPPIPALLRKVVLVAGNINGLPFLMPKEDAEYWKIPFQEMQKTPKHYSDLMIRLTFNKREEDHDFLVCHFFALEKEDMLLLMETLLTLDKAMWVGVMYKEQWLYIKAKHTTDCHHVTYDYFFPDATPEEIEYSRF